MDRNPECEGCGRGLVTRFGEEVAPVECPSCVADFELLLEAGKLEVDFFVINERNGG